jgi:polar amino acid transport system substrate-binding protein
MKNILQTLLIILTVALFFTACQKDDDIIKEETIQVSGIEFVPNFFIKNEEIVGIDADVAAEAMQNAGIDIELSMADSWETAYDAILSGPNKALLTVTYTPERKDLFKWAGPTSQGMYGIFDNGHAGHIFPLPIEKCKQLSPIAVVSNWMETTTLENLGFTNLTYYDSFDEALEAFMNGEIQYIASDFYHFTSSLPQGYFLTNINSVTRYRTVYYYIAFSKDVSDVVINKVQKEIENLIKDQSTVSILKNYLPLMPSDYIPGTIQLFTEFSPPSSYGAGHDTTRTVEGSSADIVNEIQARTGYTNKINLTLWNDAYDIVQYLPNSAVFATGRTPEREDLFQWLGPISSNKFHFYTLSSSGLAIETFEQAKTLQSVATPNGWISHDYLTDNNFQNIVATSLTTSETFNQLINEEVQAIFLPELDVTWLANVNKIPMSDLTEHLEAWTIDGYIAFSLSTPTSTVQEWQSNLDAMKVDGTFETIWNKWYEGIPMP